MTKQVDRDDIDALAQRLGGLEADNPDALRTVIELLRETLEVLRRHTAELAANRDRMAHFEARGLSWSNRR